MKDPTFNNSCTLNLFIPFVSENKPFDWRKYSKTVNRDFPSAPPNSNPTFQSPHSQGVLTAAKRKQQKPPVRNPKKPISPQVWKLHQKQNEMKKKSSN